MGGMAMSCKTFSPLECTCSLEHGGSKLLCWPFSQVALLPSSSKQLNNPHRRAHVACRARESLVSQSPTSQKDDPGGQQSDFLASQLQDAAQSGLPPELQPIRRDSQPPPTLQKDVFPEDLPMDLFPSQSQLPASQNVAQVGFVSDLQADLLVKEQEDKEEELMKGFPGAKGATIKPLTEESLAYFPAGYLEKVTSIERLDWVTVVPTGMLPKGDRLVLNHNKESVILFWFKGKIYALENRSPAAPMFEEGFAQSVITEEGFITCPITQSKYDIRTGATIDWLPNSPFLRLLTPALSDITVYAVKASPKHIFIHTKPLLVGGFYPLAEFTGNRISTDPNYEEPIIFDDLEFGFTEENELTNGRLAMLGFLTLLLIEMTTGEGILKGSGILDFLYELLPGFPVLRY
eukprot:c12840_g1_i1 orf=95-1309(+)